MEEIKIKRLRRREGKKRRKRNRAESTRLTQPTSQPIIPTLSSSLGLIYSLSPLVSLPTSSSVTTSAHLLPPNSSSAATFTLSPSQDSSLKQCPHLCSSLSLPPSVSTRGGSGRGVAWRGASSSGGKRAARWRTPASGGRRVGRGTAAASGVYFPPFFLSLPLSCCFLGRRPGCLGLFERLDA